MKFALVFGFVFLLGGIANVFMPPLLKNIQIGFFFAFLPCLLQRVFYFINYVNVTDCCCSFANDKGSLRSNRIRCNSKLKESVLGQTVFCKKESNITSTIDLSFLSKGIYFLEVIIDGERTVNVQSE